MIYLYAGQFLSKDRTATACAELFGIPISGGTIAAMMGRAAGHLDGFAEQMAGQIAAAPVAHFDETGLRVGGHLAWVHSASTPGYSLITCHPKRGKDGMNAAGVVPAFSGVACHDAFAPYDTYANIGAHQLCCAHVLRELQAVVEAADPNTWCWATQAADALLKAKTLVAASVNQDGTLDHLDPQALADARRQLTSAAVIAEHATATQTGKLAAKHHALAHRLATRTDDYLRFTTDPAIPFDNNAAEREIRMIKLRQKVSGCLRTMSGAQQFCAIRTYLATTAKHGIKNLQVLTNLTQGHPWQPQTG